MRCVNFFPPYCIKLRAKMPERFELGGFVLRLWKSSEPAVLARIPHELVNTQSTQSIDILVDHYTKVLGMEWNTTSDTFRPVVSSLKQVEVLTKRALLSDITRLYDILGWCVPVIVKPKILLQCMWRERCDWDDPVSQCILAVWQQRCSELHVIREEEVPCTYFLINCNVMSIELHGFCDTS